LMLPPWQQQSLWRLGGYKAGTGSVFPVIWFRVGLLPGGRLDWARARLSLKSPSAVLNRANQVDSWMDKEPTAKTWTGTLK